jgi:Na+/proline symporter
MLWAYVGVTVKVMNVNNVQSLTIIIIIIIIIILTYLLHGAESFLRS